MYNKGAIWLNILIYSSILCYGDLKGWGSDFFVAKYYSFYRIYDAKGKVLKAMNVSDVGEIVGVSGNTITSRKGSWIFTRNKDGKKLSARSVN